MLDERSIYLRRLVLRAMRAGRRGHWGSSSSLIEIMRVLYDDITKHGTSENPERDRIILSKGHGVLAQVVMLVDKGYIPIEALDGFCKKEGIIGGHPSPDKLPGVECHTGSLGHGLPIAVGMALAAKIKKQNHRIFVIMGDGECNEGSVWEAALSAAKHKLDNLTVIIDRNGLQSAGHSSEICPLEPLRGKWEAFGFEVAHCEGHNIEELRFCIGRMSGAIGGGIPLCIIAKTIKGNGIPFAENNPMWHYKGNIDDKMMAAMERDLE